MNTCKVCGTILDKDEKICKKCGTPIDAGGFSTGFGGTSQELPKSRSIKSLIEETGSLTDEVEELPKTVVEPRNVTPQITPQPMNNPAPQKEIDDKKIIIAIASFIVIIAGILLIFGKKIFSSDEPKKNNNPEQFVLDPVTPNPLDDTKQNEDPVVTPDPEPQEDPVTPDPNPVTPDPNPSTPDPDPVTPDPVPTDTNSITYGGYTFKIPTEYNFNLNKIENKDFLYITAKNASWGVAISIDTGAYQRIVSSKNELVELYESSGFDVSNVKEASYSNLPFVTMETHSNSNDDNAIVAFTSAGTNKVFCVTVYTIANEIDYSILENISKILYDAKLNAL